MASLVPVEGDPFAPQQPQGTGGNANLVPVDNDPFAQAPSVLDQVKRQAGLTGRYLVEGGLALPNMLADAAGGLINTGTGLYNMATGSKVPALKPSSQATSELLDKAGFPKPETAIEKIVAEPSRFMASVPSFGVPVAASRIESLQPLAQNYGQQTLGALGGGSAYGVTKELAPDNKSLQVASTIAGSLAGNQVANLVPGFAEAAPRAIGVPTTQQLHDVSNDLYTAARNSDVRLTPDAMQRLATQAATATHDFAYDPQLQPGVQVLMRRMADLAQNGAGAADIMNLKKIAAGIASSAGDNESERTLARILDRQISDFIPTLSQDEVASGNLGEFNRNLQIADHLWSRYAKANDLDERMYNARIQASATGSGGNLDNLMRQRIASILKDPHQREMYTPDEVSQMEHVTAGGGVPQTIARIISKASPQGNGLMGAGAGMALMSGHPWLAVPFAAGAIAKPINQAMTNRSVQNLSNLFRAGGQEGLVRALTQTPPNVAANTTAGNSALINLLHALVGSEPSAAASSRLTGLPAAATGTPDRNTQPRALP